MKTKHARKLMCEIFGHSCWTELKDRLKEAEEPFQITVDWKCMAIGRRLKGQQCAFGERIGRMSGVDKAYVTDHYTYIRFEDNPSIWKYKNSTEMQHQIKFFDTEGLFDDMEDGDTFILEPIGKARSAEYQEARRRAIGDGTWKVKLRGPNPNKRREPVHHFRPY